MELTPEARAARNAYMREWRKNNPTKTAEYTARKWERKAAQQAAERGNNKNEEQQST